MTLLWTNGDNAASWLIRKVTGEPCSHFALRLYNESVPIVLQSNFLGVDFQSWKMFQTKESIYDQMDFPMTQKEEDDIFDSIFNSMVSDKYDFSGAIYLGLMSLRYRVTGLAVPVKNAWSTPGHEICVRMARPLPDKVVSPAIKALDLSMVTPYHLLRMMK